MKITFAEKLILDGSRKENDTDAVNSFAQRRTIGREPFNALGKI